MKKQAIITVIVAVVVGATAFFGGMKYAQGQASKTAAQARQRFAQFAGGGGGFGRAGANGGATSGQVIAKDDTSITVKQQDGSTKIIFYSGSTQFRKFADGTNADVQVGSDITAAGTANSDGSITAQSVQLRPAGQQPVGSQPGQ